MNKIVRRYDSWNEVKSVINKLKLNRHAKYVHLIEYRQCLNKHVLTVFLLTTKEINNL